MSARTILNPPLNTTLAAQSGSNSISQIGLFNQPEVVAAGATVDAIYTFPTAFKTAPTSLSFTPRTTGGVVVYSITGTNLSQLFVALNNPTTSSTTVDIAYFAAYGGSV